MTPRRAVLYGRVSKLSRADQARAQLGQAEGRSVDQQLTELRRLAARDQVTIVAEHRDDGISASRHTRTREREGWRDTMAAITTGQVTELWVWEISRATRDRPVWAALISVCIAQAVMVTVQGKVHDPTDPDDGFMLDLMAALAVRESAVTAKRIRRDIRASAAEGKPRGRIPYGYLRRYDPTTGALMSQEPDPVFAPVVAEMFTRAAAGDSLYSIALDFNTRGLTSPHEVRAARNGRDVPRYPWSPQLVLRMLRNPTYAGLRVHNEGGLKPGQPPTVVGPATWEHIVTRETFDHAQVILNDPSRNQRPADMSVKHLLTGIALCGVCGSRCRAVKNRGYPSYACWGPPEHPGRSCVSRLQEPVDIMVTATLLTRLNDRDTAGVLARYSDTDRTDHAAARIELEQLQARLEEFRAAAEDPDLIRAGRALPVDAWMRQQAVLEPLIADARRRATPVSVPSIVRRALESGDVWRWWHGDPEVPGSALSLPERRELVRALVTVRILPSRKGARGFDPSLISIEGPGF